LKEAIDDALNIADNILGDMNLKRDSLKLVHIDNLIEPNFSSSGISGMNILPRIHISKRYVEAHVSAIVNY